MHTLIHILMTLPTTHAGPALKSNFSPKHIISFQRENARKVFYKYLNENGVMVVSRKDLVGSRLAVHIVNKEIVRALDQGEAQDELELWVFTITILTRYSKTAALTVVRKCQFIQCF